MDMRFIKPFATLHNMANNKECSHKHGGKQISKKYNESMCTVAEPPMFMMSHLILVVRLGTPPQQEK